MSTRCQIKLNTKSLDKSDKSFGKIYLYRHSDGYPEGEHGVLSKLSDLTTEFIANRGYDPEYLLAQICMRFFEPYNETKSAPSWKFCGFGVSLSKHGDIEYLYEVDAKTGLVSVKPV
jgi:hypothetical protein